MEPQKSKSVPLNEPDDGPSLSELYGQPSKEPAAQEKPINPQDEIEERGSGVSQVPSQEDISANILKSLGIDIGGVLARASSEEYRKLENNLSN